MAGPRHPEWIVVGRVSALFGVQGWVKVHSYTEPREGIGAYTPLYREAGGTWRVVEVEASRLHGKAVIMKLAGYHDRDASAALVGADLAVRREQLPAPEDGEYYWADLEGLSVETVDGVALGVVDHLLATGANDVVVVRGERERLIPFLQPQVVVEVDLEHRRMRVDWDPED